MSINNVSILSKAVANSSPVSPKVGLNTIIGIVIGLVLGLILAFVSNELDWTITDESFITDDLELNNLGIISEIPAGKVKKLISTGRITSRGSGKRRV